MPIVIDRQLPAYSILSKEKIFVMDQQRAASQDIRPIEIAILNLMPTKKETETQFMRLLSNSPLQVNITLIHMATHESRNTEKEYLDRFYQSFEDVKDRYFDGLIITGAPVENLPYEEVNYWEEFEKILDFSKEHVTSTLFICWGAMAALYHFFGIPKQMFTQKLFGNFTHEKIHFPVPDPLMRGISDEFHMCHSRHSGIELEQLENHDDLKLLAYSKEAGASILSSYDSSQVFILGHMEYDRDTLLKEYQRDLDKGLDIHAPEHYFGNLDERTINMNWTSTANLFYNNWLNFVYQTTPYQFPEPVQSSQKTEDQSEKQE